VCIGAMADRTRSYRTGASQSIAEEEEMNLEQVRKFLAESLKDDPTNQVFLTLQHILNRLDDMENGPLRGRNHE